MQALARRLLAHPDSHVDLLVGQFLLLGARITQAGRQGQTMRVLKRLRRLDGAAGLPLTKPDFAVQPDTTGDDMDVVLVGVLVAHGHPRRGGRIKAHALHEVAGHGFPLVSTQALAGRQRQRAMPDWLADVRAQLAHGGELPRQFARVVPAHVAADALRILIVRSVAANVKDVVQRTAKAGPPANLSFHRRRPWRRA